MTIMRCEAAATIFSRSSAPPPPLISVEIGVDLVGAVDGEVELRRLLERRQRHAELHGKALRCAPRSARR